MHPPKSPKIQRLEKGSEVVQQDIDILNARYRELVAKVTQQMDSLLGAGKVLDVSLFVC